MAGTRTDPRSGRSCRLGRARRAELCIATPVGHAGMRIHVIAVSGTGMGALAGLLVELGHEVTGSDVAFDPPIGPALVEWGVRCVEGFDPSHLDPAPDLVIV